MTIIRVGIVDDHPIVRAGLQQFLGEQVDLRIVGDAADGRAALDLVRTGELDVLLMDVSMPGTSGVEALQAIKARAPALPVVILSGLPAAHYAVNLLRMGASAYLNKEGDPEQILQAIHTVVRGRRFITPEVAECFEQVCVAPPGAEPGLPAAAAQAPAFDIAARLRSVWQ